jgi:Mg-chelatase subunit ChlD
MRKRLWAIFMTTVLALTYLMPATARAAAPDLAGAVQRGAAWLGGAQRSDGSWGAMPRLATRDTAATVIALRDAGGLGPAVDAGAAWLVSAPGADTDSLARRLEALAPAPELAARILLRQNADGGWGLAPGYASDPLDTALALGALAGAGPSDAVAKGAAALAALQGPDGSWGVQAGAGGNVYTTAHALIALGEAGRAGVPVSTAALRNGATWLLERQSSDGSWGSLSKTVLTALAYRGALQGAAATRVGPAPAWLANAQSADGSWEGQAYATAEAMRALSVAAQLPNATLSGARLAAPSPTGPVPAASFRAYEPVLLETDPLPSGLALEAVVEGIAQGSFAPGDDGALSWSTGATPPGAYQVLVLLKETGTGLILDEQRLPLTIEETVGLRGLEVMVAPAATRVGEAVSPQVVPLLSNGSNVAASITLTGRVMNAAGAPVAEETQTVALTPGEDPTMPPWFAFTPDVTAPGEYRVTVTASTGAEAVKTFRVLPPPAPVRIDVTKNVSPTQVEPGEATVSVDIALQGMGSAEQPGRQPIDLVLTIDNSGSMEWGDVPWVITHPNRSDAARAASKAVVDLLGETDRGALVTFSYTFYTYVRQGLTANRDLLKSRIDQYVTPWGATAIGAGLQTARNHLRANSPATNKQVIILLSDGEETEWTKTRVRNEAVLAAQQGILIYTIGLGATADKALLEELATLTGGRFYFSPTMDDLQAIMEELGRSLLQNAGKNVRVVDTIPAAGVELDASSITPEPYSVTRTAENWVVEWRFDEIAIGTTQPLALDLNLSNLAPGEVREVNHQLVLTYEDQDGRMVTEELGPYTVQVTEPQVAGDLTLDRAEYGPNEPVLVTAELRNAGSAPQEVQAVIEVLDGAGSLVATLLTVTTALAGGGMERLTAEWNTGTAFAGPYVARLRLTANGLPLGGDQEDFTILADGGAALTTNTDKLIYQPGERVQIANRVVSESSNAVLTGLRVLTTVTAPDGRVVVSAQQPVAELVPGGLADLTAQWAETAGAAPGTYTVHSVLMQDADQLAERTVTFVIASSAETGAGLTGEIAAQPLKTLPSGDVDFAYTVRNGGNGPVAGQLHVLVADPSTGAELADLTAPLDLAVGAEVAGELSYRFDDLPEGPMLAAFFAELPSGVRVPLGSTGFTVVRPFTLTAQVETGVRRVLVWSGPGEVLARITANLEAQGVWYTVVADAAAFQRELRSGAYSAYILAGAASGGGSGAAGLDHLDWELREKVYGGAGLILLGPAALPQLNDEQHRAGTWLGARAGTVPDHGYSATLGQGRILWTDFALATVDEVLNRAVPAVAGPLGAEHSAGPVAVRFAVTGGPLPVGARVRVDLPAGSAVVAAPEAESTEPALTYRFDLAPGEVKAFTFIVTLAEAGTIDLEGFYFAHDAEHRTASASVDVGAMPGGPDLIAAVRAALPAPGDKAGQNLVQSLNRTLTDLEAHPPQTAQELDRAIHRLLQDLGQLAKLGNRADGAHLAYVRLLSYYQARWARGEVMSHA